MARTISEKTTTQTFLDTNVYNTITADSSQPITPSLGVKSAKSTGVVKLINMFLKLLYTVPGSNYLDKTEGTNFVRIYDIAPSDEDAVLTRVQTAVDAAAEQIMYNQSLLTVPDNEKLQRAYVDSFSITYDSGGRSQVNITIGLEVVSGSNVAVQLPSTLHV